MYSINCLLYVSQSCVDDVAGEDAFDVVDYAAIFVGEEAADVKVFELVVGYAEDDGVVLLACGQAVDNVNVILVFYGLGVGPGVVDGDVGGVFGQGVVDVDYLGVADVGAVLLECDTEDEDFGVLDF